MWTHPHLASVTLISDHLTHFSEFAKFRAFRPSCLTCLTRLCAVRAFVPQRFRSIHAFVFYAPSRFTSLTYTPYLRALPTFFTHLTRLICEPLNLIRIDLQICRFVIVWMRQGISPHACFLKVPKTQQQKSFISFNIVTTLFFTPSPLTLSKINTFIISKFSSF